MPTSHKVTSEMFHECNDETSPHRIMVLQRIANPRPPGLAGSIPAVGVFIILLENVLKV